MKTAIYIEDGLVQLVLTPEGEFEKNALTTLKDKPIETNIYQGSFKECRGGHIRMYQDQDSLFLVNREVRKDGE